MAIIAVLDAGGTKHESVVKTFQNENASRIFNSDIIVQYSDFIFLTHECSFTWTVRVAICTPLSAIFCPADTTHASSFPVPTPKPYNESPTPASHQASSSTTSKSFNSMILKLGKSASNAGGGGGTSGQPPSRPAQGGVVIKMDFVRIEH